MISKTPAKRAVLPPASKSAPAGVSLDAGGLRGLRIAQAGQPVNAGVVNQLASILSTNGRNLKGTVKVRAPVLERQFEPVFRTGLVGLRPVKVAKGGAAPGTFFAGVEKGVFTARLTTGKTFSEFRMVPPGTKGNVESRTFWAETTNAKNGDAVVTLTVRNKTTGFGEPETARESLRVTLDKSGALKRVGVEDDSRHLEFSFR